MNYEALALFEAGKLKEAIEKFEECLAIDGLNAYYNSNILLHIATALVKLNKKDQII